MVILKKLPDIYKSVVHTNPNQNTFYSNSFHGEGIVEKPEAEKKILVSSKDKLDIIQEIFKNKNYSYTKRVRVAVAGRTFETRFVQEYQGQILTIDNEIIDIEKIDAIEIV